MLFSEKIKQEKQSDRCLKRPNVYYKSMKDSTALGVAKDWVLSTLKATVETEKVFWVTGNRNH